MAGYTRQSVASIINGLEVTAPPLNAEFNQIAASHNGSTGHTHDGTTGQGPKINLATSIIGQLPPANGGGGGANLFTSENNPTSSNDVTQDFDTGSIWGNKNTGRLFFCITGAANAAIWRELVQVQFEDKIVPEATDTVDLGSDTYRFKDLFLSGDIDAAGDIASGGDLNVGGSLTVSDGIEIIGDIVINGGGVADLDNVDIDGGTIDGTAIGNDVPSTGIFTTLNATSGITGTLTGDVTGNLTGNVDGDVTGDVIGALTGDVTGNLTGNVEGDLTGDVTGNLTGNVTGDTSGTHTGPVVGNVTGSITDTGTSTFEDVIINGTLDMTDGAIQNLTSPTLEKDATNKLYVDGEITGLADEIAEINSELEEVQKEVADFSDNYLPITGGTLTGALVTPTLEVSGTLDMTDGIISNVADPVADGDAVNKGFMDGAIADALLDGSGAISDVFVNIDGDTMTGDLSIDADLSVTGTASLPAIEQVDNININAGTVKWITGAGEPEAVVSASVGSIYANTAASPGDGTLFIKTSGDGSIGWEEAGAGVAPPIEPGDGTNALFTETFEGDGINNTVTLNNEPASINNTQVYVSGVYQLKSTYSLAGKVITFTEIPPDGRSIEVVIASNVTFEDSEFVNQSGDTMTGALKIEDNLEVTGETNTGTLVVGDGVTIDAILDEDDMVSDSDTAVPTQQSVKKYVLDTSVKKSGDTMTGALTVNSTITSTGKVSSSALETTGLVAVGGNLTVTGTTNAKRINGVGIFSVKSAANAYQILTQDGGYTRLYNKGTLCLETTSYGALIKKLKIGARNTTSSYVLWRDEASTSTEFNGGITHSTYGAYGSFYPCKQNGDGKDKKINWGSDTNPWKTFYASVGTINTSDKTFKQDIEDITEAEHCVARRLRRKFKTYRWQQSVGRKGDDARTYTGLMAQDVEQCFRDEGLDPAKYAMWHRTEYKQTSTTNADGTVETTNYDLGDENTPDDAVDKVTYGLNYVEILCFILSAEAADREKLTDRLSTLEGRLLALEAKDSE